MSFAEQEGRGRPGPIAAVILVHAALGYALINGLAYTVIDHIPLITVARDIPPDPAPPPPPHADPVAGKPQPRATVPDPIIRRSLPPTDTVITVNTDSFPILKPDVMPVITPPPMPPRSDLARGATVSGDRAGWVTSDDYPPASLHAGTQGTTGIVVTIGVNGRVEGCVVTDSSGDTRLDEAACRLYAKRARFSPALDDAGRPVATHRADRVRWQIPRD